MIRAELRAKGLSEEEIEDEVIDRIHPLRWTMVRWGRPTLAERVAFAERMRRLDEQWGDKPLPPPKRALLPERRPIDTYTAGQPAPPDVEDEEADPEELLQADEDAD